MKFPTIFFVAPIKFKYRLAEVPQKHLLQLSFALRRLLDSSAGKDNDVAETLLNDFCSLPHLAHQCRAFGPLFHVLPCLSNQQIELLTVVSLALIRIVKLSAGVI